MPRGTTGEAQLYVDGAPEVVYGVVTDVTRMGEWSPETTKCVWLDGATGPAVGARFKGSNRRGLAVWSTKPRVVVADEGREFSFVVPSMIGGKDLTKWTYRFEPATDGGTDVIESFDIVNDIPGVITLCDRYLLGIKDRRADLVENMGTTLERLKKAAEGSA